MSCNIIWIPRIGKSFAVFQASPTVNGKRPIFVMGSSRRNIAVACRFIRTKVKIELCERDLICIYNTPNMQKFDNKPWKSINISHNNKDVI